MEEVTASLQVDRLQIYQAECLTARFSGGTGRGTTGRYDGTTGVCAPVALYRRPPIDTDQSPSAAAVPVSPTDLDTQPEGILRLTSYRALQAGAVAQSPTSLLACRRF